MLPVVALAEGGEEAEQIAIGSIVGAPHWARIAGAIALLLGYGAYVRRTAAQSGDAGDESEPGQAPAAPPQKPG